MEFAIDLPSDLVLTPDVEKSVREQAFYLSEATSRISFQRDPRGTHRLLLETPAEMLPVDLPERMIDLVRKISTSFKRVEVRVYTESAGTGTSLTDPHPELFATGQITETMPGLLNIQGDLLRLIRALDRCFFQMAETLGSIEQEYPTTLPLRSMVENGYVASFPQHAIFASPVRGEFSHLQAVEDICRTASESEVPDLRDHLAHMQQTLAPTVCYHCFEGLKGRKLSESNLVVTALAKCHRHEYRTVHGLERLQTFTMREIIYYGDSEFIASTRDAIVRFCEQLMRHWGVTFRLISASDPFFAIEASKKRLFQNAYGLKQELQMLLPYSEKFLAVGSFNNHRDSLVKAYGIQGRDEGLELHSGCVGFGYERMALALFAQFGLEFSKWPESLRALVGES